LRFGIDLDEDWSLAPSGNLKCLFGAPLDSCVERFFDGATVDLVKFIDKTKIVLSTI